MAVVGQLESARLVSELNGTYADWGPECLIHELFEAQAAEHPDAVALVHDDREVTYYELNGRANRVAHRLVEIGVRPDDRVALHIDRGLAMLVAVLGTIKAGAAYVPLDPSYPRERIEFMLKDSAPGALISDGSTRNPLNGNAIPEVRLENHGQAADLLRQPTVNIDPKRIGLTPRNLAYVIYTSGSTGKPKGVMVEHDAVVNFLHSMSRSPGISRDDCLLSVTTLSFDIAALELFLPLITGARIVLTKRSGSVDVSEIERALEQHNVTIMQATPATWHMLLMAGWKGKADLKILCGGEALSSDLARNLRERAASLWNMYGPTETTIWSTCHQVVLSELAERGIESIGRPIANTQIYILDSDKDPVPFGSVGEIYVGGRGVARGYLNQKDLTAERFVLDKFDQSSNRRIYRTGDQGRYLPGGSIEYFGRVDFQIKVRGFRIEPGEIEAQLTSIAGVHQSIVVLKKDQFGLARVVAYFTSDERAYVSQAELRKALSEKLPEYMVPSLFVRLERLPLTSNNKIDRLALPDPHEAEMQSETFQEPLGLTEVAIASVWQELLGAQRIGRSDSFFERGGHSLLAVQLISRLKKLLGVNITVGELSAHPTLADFAAAVEDKATAAVHPI
jgi:amino acid adenylation domain-containing protein